MNLFLYKETHFFAFIQFSSLLAQLCYLVAHPVGIRKHLSSLFLYFLLLFIHLGEDLELLIHDTDQELIDCISPCCQIGGKYTSTSPHMIGFTGVLKLL